MLLFVGYEISCDAPATAVAKVVSGADNARCGMKRLLGGVLRCHDVADTEGFVRRVLADALRGRNSHLRPDDEDDAVAYLVSEAWRLSLDFDPDRSRSFSGYAYKLLKLRYVDWLRRTEGRTRWQFGDGKTYERERPQLVSLDVATDDDGGRLVETLPAQSSDRQTSVSPALTRILGVRGFGDPRDIDLLRASPSRRVA